jgi:YbgC/YbaW family acyl-CoA thioester hydrolase
MSNSWTKTFTVRFGDTDLAGIAYYPRMFDFIHKAMEDFFAAQCGVTYPELISERRVGFPLVKSEVDFRSPLFFGDEATISVTTTKVGNSSIGFRYRFSVGERECFDARMTVCCVEMDTVKPIPIPKDLRPGLEAVLETDA